MRGAEELDAACGSNYQITNRWITNLGLEQGIMKPTAEPTTLTAASFEDLVREMIVRLGEDPNREGLTRTPGRV